ncbi:unnamed protein product [Linum tenue]|uniref:Peptidase metallopeptidase domain-containing protein n=2 Tax=Linum tenue TaxID=586396 RepID=A0AAV0IGB0_9ROSI|nr:unnamed protein product [Linum tenue]
MINSPTFAAGHTNDNPFQRLEGCRKGESTKGLHNLKQYLQKFGYYLNHNNNNDTNFNVAAITHQNDDVFDELLEAAIKLYQLTHHIPASGSLDRATTAQMTIPRCGVPDHNLISAVMLDPDAATNKGGPKKDYRFFKGEPKWNQNRFRYKFFRGRPPAGLKEATYKSAVARAFRSWSNVTRFAFENVDSRVLLNVDMTIAFYSRDHGDGNPFDGPKGTLAHAAQPRYGLFHLDADEKWTDNPRKKDQFDLESISLHEIGHMLGLDHSDDKSAAMYAYLDGGKTKRRLQSADIRGIKTLYKLR